MNILVTGANGLLGRHLVELLGKKHKVLALVKNKEKLNFILNQNISVIEVNLAKIDLEVLPKKIDAIYYLAQSNRFREFPDGVDDMLSINVVVPNILAKWAVNHGVKKFVYASSGGVYTNPNKPAQEFFDINANEKLGFYLNSKLSAEMLLKNYANMFETFAIIRPFFMYGIGQNETMLIPRLIQSIKNGNEITLDGENGIRINPIDVRDAALAVSKVLTLRGEHIINIAGKEIISIKELCIVVENLLNKKAIFSYASNSRSDIIANISIMNDLLCHPRIALRTGISNMIGSL